MAPPGAFCSEKQEEGEQEGLRERRKWELEPGSKRSIRADTAGTVDP
jgi:hypothetical protein